MTAFQIQNGARDAVRLLKNVVDMVGTGTAAVRRPAIDIPVH